ncbi:MAG: UDP-3-O-(3-hydroxymyristoyl)glucosamine N-acyltransferase [Rickettsiales bacterium]
MADPRFFENSGAISLTAIAEITGATVANVSSKDVKIKDVAPLDRAGPEDIGFLDNAKYVDSFRASRAGACFIREKHVRDAPASMAVLITEDPYRCYALVAQKFYPFIPLTENISSAAHIDKSAKLGKNLCIAPGAVIGKNVEIGDGCMIGANAVIHDGVKIGTDTRIGALCSISHAYIGDHVIIHRSVHIGQDGFGFALGREGHVKVPQLGRVIIEDHVEIGAGTCIDRGTGPDTVIGEGTKIDNLVQIGHNVQIGRGAVIVAQVGISGSTRIGDGAVLGGQVGIAGHLRIGAGARIAAQAGVMSDIPSGETHGGSPSVPIKDWHRQTIAVAQLVKQRKNHDDGK